MSLTSLHLKDYPDLGERGGKPFRITPGGLCHSGRSARRVFALYSIFQAGLVGGHPGNGCWDVGRHGWDWNKPNNNRNDFLQSLKRAWQEFSDTLKGRRKGGNLKKI